MSGYLNSLVQRALGLGARVPVRRPGRVMPRWTVSGMAPLPRQPAASILQSVPPSAAGISATRSDPPSPDILSVGESSGEPAGAAPQTPLDDKPEAEALLPRQAAPHSSSTAPAAPYTGQAEAATPWDRAPARVLPEVPAPRAAPSSDRSRPSADPVPTENDIGRDEGSASEAAQKRSPIQWVSPAVEREFDPTLLMPLARSSDPEPGARPGVVAEGAGLAHSSKASLKRETEQPVSEVSTASAAIAREMSKGDRPTPAAKRARTPLPLTVPARPSPVAFAALPRGQAPDRVEQSSSVQVRIGRVEVRAAPAWQISAPAVATARPTGGFDDYLSVRSYGRTV